MHFDDDTMNMKPTTLFFGWRLSHLSQMNYTILISLYEFLEEQQRIFFSTGTYGSFSVMGFGIAPLLSCLAVLSPFFHDGRS